MGRGKNLWNELAKGPEGGSPHPTTVVVSKYPPE